MPQFNVLTPLRHNGKLYSPGAVVEMTQQQAAALLGAAAITLETVSQKETLPVFNEQKPAVETALSNAISGLEKTDQSLWMKDGRPRTEALSATVGHRITAKQRDQAWQQWIEENRP
jgi:hypothetical protein